MAERATHYRWEELPHEQLSPLIGRRLINGDAMMIAQVYLAKHRLGALLKKELVKVERAR